ncbi:MFS transporter [Clostridium sediminicola]|uniref:MFS transporter n=1 Tax=Clostridium sediminicola TaxID=3114879 RepID=UPI0031F2697D
MDAKKSVSGDNRVLFLDKIGYGVGNFGFGVVSQLISSYLVFYSTAILNIPGGLIGIAISISVVWDSISDPLMGYISDKTNIKGLGRRHLYIIIGTIATAVFNILLWMIDPSLSTNIKFFWILVDILILKSFMTVYATPYTALGAELSNDYDERTSIQSIKMSFFMLGIAFATAVSMVLFFRPTESFPIGQLNPEAYKNMAIVSSILMVFFGLVCFYSTKKYIKVLPKSNKNDKSENALKSLFNALKNEDYRVVVIGYLFTNISSAILGSVGLHVFTYTFLMGNYKIAIILGIQLGMGIISQPFWLWFSKKKDKKPAVILGLVLSIIASSYFVIMVFLKEIVRVNFTYLIPFALIGGFGTGGLFTLPLSMIADTTDEEELNTGRRIEGVYYGGMTLGYKLSQAVAIFILGMILDIVNFDSSLEIQSDFTAMVLGLILGIGCIISFLLAAMSYRKYSITKEKMKIIQEDIVIARQQNLILEYDE